MKVSAIMPTANRREFIAEAIACFAAQDYPDVELIVLDNGSDQVADLIPVDHRIRYVPRQGEKLNTGQMRNACCELARGEVVVHFDDDDWSAPTRISSQVRNLEESGKQVGGYYSMTFADVNSGLAYRYERRKNYVLGTSLCYRRAWWESHRFPEKSTGEDRAFSDQADAAGQLFAEDCADMMVARAHSRNTSRKQLNKPAFMPIGVEALPSGFREAMCSLAI